MSKDVQIILKHAEETAQQKGLRFTEQRRVALEIIASADKPMGAYDVLEQMGSYIKNPKPPIAYRALEFLQENNFIHRIESLNAYVICSTNHEHKGSQFMVCDKCGKVFESHICTIPDNLQNKAKETNFQIAYWNVEIHGICADCQG